VATPPLSLPTTSDFSDAGSDNRKPHSDLAHMFNGQNSQFWISIVDAMKSVDPDLLEDHDTEFNWNQEPRRLSEILEAAHLLDRQVWYNRHWNVRIAIEKGEARIVTSKEWRAAEPRSRNDLITEGTWKGALASARKTEKEVGIDNLGPWTDFEWGMVNGKLSALRWALGEDWDELYT
jgi:hypothetical protein